MSLSRPACRKQLMQTVTMGPGRGGGSGQRAPLTVLWGGSGHCGGSSGGFLQGPRPGDSSLCQTVGHLRAA